MRIDVNGKILDLPFRIEGNLFLEENNSLARELFEKENISIEQVRAAAKKNHGRLFVTEWQRVYEIAENGDLMPEDLSRVKAEIEMARRKKRAKRTEF